MNCDIVNLTICLSDLEQSEFYTSPKNNKKYLNISIASRKEKDKFDNDVTIQYKRNNKQEQTKYLKNSYGKQFNFNPKDNNVNSNNTINNNNNSNDDNLPF